MALYKYDGPYPEVEVRVAGETVGVVQKGGSIVVPDDLAAKVAFSEEWTKVDPSKDTKPVAPAAPAPITSEGQK